MKSLELRTKFLDFFAKRGHKIIASSSLLPSDPSVLFTTAGMQQLAPYLEGMKNPVEDFGNRHLVDVQKCFRSNDINQVGDDTHHTFFEMLGNWSIGTDKQGEYFKEGAIKYALDFLVGELCLDKDRIWATVFQGEGSIPKDSEAIGLWQKYGIPKERIVECSAENNFWGPTALTGPCGPCSEIHYDRGSEYGCGKENCGPNCLHCNRFVEVWNLVFMQYRKDESGQFIKLSQTNIDTGTGFERLLSIVNRVKSAYETDLFDGVLRYLEQKTASQKADNQKSFRIISDHLRGVCFLISDGVKPSNLGQGYILRKILRRAMFHFYRLQGANSDFFGIAQQIIVKYQDVYPELKEKSASIEEVINEEGLKFYSVLGSGVEKFTKEFPCISANGGATALGRKIPAERSFHYHQSLGLTIEIQRDLASENGYVIDEEEFALELKKHQEISRAGAAKLFGGHGVGDIRNEEDKNKVVRLHTATHLLQATLRKVLGEGVGQQGSNITPERLRFDFSFDRKMTPEEIRQVEDLVNEIIKQDLPVNKEEMSYDEAIKSGALAFFKEKYPEKVSVYSIGDFSKELCGGPHVARTGEIGNFKILKEEASSAGIRRIKANVE